LIIFHNGQEIFSFFRLEKELNISTVIVVVVHPAIDVVVVDIGSIRKRSGGGGGGHCGKGTLGRLRRLDMRHDAKGAGEW
jgi:hypothetical protein